MATHPTVAEPASHPSWRVRVVLVVISTLVALAFAEGLVRVIAPPATFAVDVATFRAAAVVPDAVLGWTLRPDTHVTVHARTYTISSEGTRGPANCAAACIVVAGDSVTMGWGVGDDETYPAVLARTLHRDVVNGGVLGYGVTQDVARLEQLVTATHATTALLGYFPNDPEDAHSVPVPPPHHASRLIELLAQRFASANGDTAMTAHHRALHAPGSAGWQRVEGALGEMARFCAARAIRCGVLLLPELTRVPYPLADVHERVRVLAHRDGLGVLDLASTLGTRDPRTRWAAPDDSHPDAATQRAYGEAVAEWVRGGRW